MQRQCKYGNSCRNTRNCPFYHPHPHQPVYCHFREKCRNLPHCRFYHPERTLPVPMTETETQSSLASNWGSERYETHSEPGVGRFRGDEEFGEGFSDRDQGEGLSGGGDGKGEGSFGGGMGKMGKMDGEVKQEEEGYNALNQIHREQERYLERMLEQFFNIRLIKSTKFDIIYSLIEQNVSLQNVPLLIQQIQKLQQSEFAPHFTYLKLVKTIITKKLNYPEICKKLQKQYKIKLKKQEKLAAFLRQIPEPIAYQVLTDGELIGLYGEKGKEGGEGLERVFVVDGDNVLNTHRVFRRYYRSRSRRVVAEGQVRLRWLLSEVGNCQLYYDYQKISQQHYKAISSRIMYEDELDNYMKLQWQFANPYAGQLEPSEKSFSKDNGEEEGEEGEEEGEDEDNEEEEEDNQEEISENGTKDERKTADMLIIEYFQQQKKKDIDKPGSNGKKQLILVTGDRLLIQKCLQISTENTKILISSGQFFIKYCKEHIRRKYYGNKMKKGVIKRIFIDPQ